MRHDTSVLVADSIDAEFPVAAVCAELDWGETKTPGDRKRFRDDPKSVARAGRRRRASVGSVTRGMTRRIPPSWRRPGSPRRTSASVTAQTPVQDRPRVQS